MATIVFDTETAPNMFLLMGKILESGEYFGIWGDDEGARENIKSLFKSKNTFISFNGSRYDMPVISYFLSGKSELDCKKLGDAIIGNNMMPWDAEREFGFRIPMIDHIDLIEVAPSFVSLKTYGARMNMPTVQDLPFKHTDEIKPEDRPVIWNYCKNDLDTTEALYNKLQGQLQLRMEISKEYGFDARSKSDSQVAEQMFIKRLGLKRTKAKIPESVRYITPSFINFKRDDLNELAQRMSDHVYEVKQSTGHVVLPDFLKDDLITINKGIYQMGVGGLHSQHDRKVCYVTDDEYQIVDYDVASYYPSILLNCNLVPVNTGERFIEEYRKVFERRLEGKRQKNMVIADSLRIALNGTFGKTASKYSALYSPDVMINITLTGQLTLLMLIETLEENGVQVVSANTDGIMLKHKRNEVTKVHNIIKEFSELTGFIFEDTPYRVVALKDVNNYFAVKQDRSVKIKGIYSAPTLSKNPTAPVVSKAVGLWLAYGTKFKDTVLNSPLTDFISVRSVTGGGVQGDKYLGKTVRWLQTTSKLPPLTYATNGNKVAKTDGARECMTLPTGIPEDLDYNWYYKEIMKVIKDIGASKHL
jgi:hypothetical protein